MPSLADRLEQEAARREGVAQASLADRLDQVAAARQAPTQRDPVDYILETGANVPASAGRLAGDLWSAISNPVQTAEGIGKAAVGGAQQLKDALGVPTMGTFGDQRAVASAIGQHYADRYGGGQQTLDTIRTDPVGFLADAAAPFTLGVAAAPRALGTAGRIGRLADPVSLAAEGVAKTGRGAGKVLKNVLGMTTGTGGQAVGTAFRSGVAGGELASKFRDAMRGTVPMEAVVDEARAAVSNLYQQRGAQYRQNMAAIKEDPTVLDFTKIDEGLAKMEEIKTFKGRSISKPTEGVRAEIAEEVGEWRALPAAEYHTVEGFDALKQSIGEIRDKHQFGTPEWKAGNEAYKAIADTITAQAPGYARVMKDYAEATKLLTEMQKELSLGNNAGVGTSLRKLQAIIRDDVSSAYGRRAELADILGQGGARGLRETLAGQSMSSALPRGLRGASSTTGGLGAIGLGGGLNPATAGGMLGYALASSPRIVGEAAHAAGRMARPMAGGLPIAPRVAAPATLGYQYQRAQR